ncbi:protein FAM234B isoform X1 [Nelusetta ayraudi]|uniref:protein FAM234B isoform X1 n=1 Tax=Nelusetta ayraudi TaxID=303726 RepID=UPI003F70240A
MAAALSRALKLPGKKGPDLGEYDPLTQADSEDESEEDDLVLNYPRNGLGRDGCLGSGSSKLRGGRSGRLVGAEDDAPEDEEEEEEEDKWREGLKSKQAVGDLRATQYWSSHRDAGRDRSGEDRGGSGPLGGAVLGAHGADAEAKRVRNAVRSAFFLVPLVCAMLLVLLCAFLIPCRKGELERRMQWERALGVIPRGGFPPALAMWDLDGDSLQDVLVGVTEYTNNSRASKDTKAPVYSAVALSALGGQVLWRKVLQESVTYIQCGLQLGTQQQQQQPVVILVSKSTVMAVNGSTGRTLWSVQLRSIESQAVLLPDLQGDSVPDLLVATLPADEDRPPATSNLTILPSHNIHHRSSGQTVQNVSVMDLSLNLISGLTGAKLGNPVPFNLTGQGKLVGPLLHETQQGAYYILFGLGNVEAVSLGDVYFGVTGTKPQTPALLRKDQSWERLKKTNASSFIHIYRGSEHLEFLSPLVDGFGNSHDCLDSAANLNSTRSDWVLVYTSGKVSVLRQSDLRKDWTFISPPMHSQPAPGHYHDSVVLDLFIQHSAGGVMQAQVVSGSTGRALWSAEFVCPDLRLGPSAIASSSGKSVFLFWASEPIRGQKNATKTTVAPAEPRIRRLFLLHPAYPTVLLELTNTTDTIKTSAVSYLERQKDATYITVSSRPMPDPKPDAQVVKSMSLKLAVAQGRVVRLGEGSRPGGEPPAKPADSEISKFFRRLSFKRQ